MFIGFVLVASSGRADVSPSGAFTTSVAIKVPAYHGLAPQLAVQYNSQRANGDLGAGWKLAGLSEIRAASATKGVPQGNPDDVFLLDGNELIPCPQPAAAGHVSSSPSCKYASNSPNTRPFASRIERYSRIEFASSPFGGSWSVWDTSGVKSTYLPVTGRPAWHLSKVEDLLGNSVSYIYASGTLFPLERIDRIAYNNTLVRFYWEDRPDVLSFGTGNDLRYLSQRLKAIDVQVENARARAYGLDYEVHPITRRSNLTKVSVFGRNAQIDSAGTITGTALPPATIDYAVPLTSSTWTAHSEPPVALPVSAGTPQLSQYTTAPGNATGGRLRVRSGDFDGDGRADVLTVSFNDTTDPKKQDSLHVAVRLATQEWKHTDLAFDTPSDTNGYGSTWVADVNGDGFSDLIVVGIAPHPTENVNLLTLRTALGNGDGTFTWSSVPTQVTSWPTTEYWGGLLVPQVPQCTVGDFNGDGRADFACMVQDARPSQLGKQSLGVATARRDGGFQISPPQVIAQDTGLIPTDDPSTALDESKVPLPFETRRLTAGDTNHDGLDDLMILDLNPADVAACAAMGDPLTFRATCQIHFDLFTGISTGSDFTFQRVPTPWLRDDYRDSFPNSVTAADLNGDGRADYVNLAGPGKVPGSQKISRIDTAIVGRDGSYTFKSQTLSPGTAGQQVDYAFGDADGDGRTDLLAVAPVGLGFGTGCTPTLYQHPVMFVARSNGDGTFQLPPSWDNCPAGTELTPQWATWPPSIEGRFQAVDTNGDGLADFVFTNVQAPALDQEVIYAFDRTSVRSGADTHRWIATDLDGDGRTDFVYIAHEQSGNTVASLIRGASGLTASRDSLPDFANSSLSSWKIADFNCDGRADIVHLQPLAGPAVELQLFVSEGNGQFSAAGGPLRVSIPRPLPLSAWRVGDIDGDGCADLLQTFTEPGPGGGPAALFVKSIRGGPTGTWTDDAVSDPISVAPLPSADYVTAFRNWQLADIDGDGRPELVHILPSQTSVRLLSLMRSQNGTWRPVPKLVDNPLNVTWSQVRGVDADSLWRAVDVNGDGLADFVRQLATTTGDFVVHTLLSNGNGTYVAKAMSAPLAAQSVIPNTAGTLDWQVADVNGDGLFDFVQLAKRQGSARATVLYSVGTGEWRAESVPVDGATSFESADLPGWQVADLLGNHEFSLVRVSARTSPSQPQLDVVALSSAQDVIHRYQGDGPAVTLTYSSPSAFLAQQSDPACRLPLGATVMLVGSTVTEVGTDSYSASYKYSCARWSQFHRTFLGWNEVQAIVPATTNRPARTDVRWFVHSDECLTQPQHVYKMSAQGNIVDKRSTVAYFSPGPQAPYNCLTMLVHDQKFAANSTVSGQDVYTNFTYDEFGNISSVLSQVLQVPGSARLTTRTYKYATGPYIVDRISGQQMHAGPTSAGQVVKASVNCYDGDITAGCTEPLLKGQLTERVDIWEQGTAKTDYVYDAVGNIAGIRDANGHGTAVFFDNVQSVYPTSEVNALSQTTRQTEWDRVLGVATKVTDQNNSATLFGHDEYGRLTDVTYATGLLVHREFVAWDDVANRRIREEVTGPLLPPMWSEQYVDALGRVTRLRRSGRQPGEVLTQSFEYGDVSQLPYKIWTQEVDGSQANGLHETFFYDEAGRVSSIRHSPHVRTPAGFASRRFTYGIESGNEVVTLTDENNGRHQALTDAYGRIVEARDYNGLSPVATKFLYDLGDRISDVIDANGNVTHYEWDMLGRQKSVTDPNLGKRVKVHDLVGNLLKITDAMNQTTTLAYDELNRLKSKTFPNKQQIIWRYDEPGHGAGLGRLTSTTDENASGCLNQISSRYIYDPVGRVVGLQQCVEGTRSIMEFAYDAAGRPTSVTYPDREKVTYGYDRAGWASSLGGYVNNISYDTRGRTAGFSLANGVVATLAYDALAGDISSEVYAKEKVIYSAAYAYTANGMLLGSSSPTNQMNLSYVHDSLRRLRSISGDFVQQWTYDSVGNMQTNSAVGTYTYPAQGPQGCNTGGTPAPCKWPHAAQSAGIYTLHYDDNGQLASIDNTATGKTRSIDWTFDGLPSAIKDFDGTVTQYRYDAFRHLVKQISHTDTLTLFNPFTAQSATDGLIKNYYVGRRRVATRIGSPRYWLHSDRRSSVRAMTDDAGQLIERMDYTPFGRLVTATLLDSMLRYRAARADHQTHLVYMGARFYDPVLERFISGDTILPAALNTQGPNRYAFAYNSPVRYEDRSGHISTEIGRNYSASPVPFSDFDFSPVRNPAAVMGLHAALSIAAGSLGLGGVIDLEPRLLKDLPQRLGNIEDDFLDHVWESLFGAVTGGLEGTLPAGWLLPFDSVPERLGFDPHQAAWFNVFRGLTMGVIGGAEIMEGAEIASIGSVPTGLGAVTSETGVGAVVGVGGAGVMAIGGVVAVEGASDVVAGAVVALKAGIYIIGPAQGGDPSYTGKTVDDKRRAPEHERSGKLDPKTEKLQLVLEVDPKDPVIKNLAEKYGETPGDMFNHVLRGGEQWYMEHCPTCVKNVVSSMARTNPKFDYRVIMFLEYMEASGKMAPFAVFEDLP